MSESRIVLYLGRGEVSRRLTGDVLATVRQERAIQQERWDDSDKTPDQWDLLLGSWLSRVETAGPERYVRLVQLAAIAVAAAEAVDPSSGSQP